MSLPLPLPFEDHQLPAGVRSRFVDDVNGLRMHVLEAGFETPGRPCVLMLHGFPELAYSWRKVMAPLAQAGYHVIAPDQRGYGRTTGWTANYDDDLTPFRMLNRVRDALGLLAACGYESVAAVIGHDFGSPVAAWCALVRPDVFRAVVLMSAPFAGPPPLPRGPGAAPVISALGPKSDIHRALAALPRPRKHYQAYYTTREAAADMLFCPQGLPAFFRSYYYQKSASWTANRPVPLASWTATELARMPTYYVMDLDQNMAQTVADEMPSAEQIAACTWMTDDDVLVYSGEYARTGFQGPLQWYRCSIGDEFTAEQQTWSGRTIDVPACFIAGSSDWGIHQRPGGLQKMATSVCTRFQGSHLIEGAGHWVQQEQPEQVSRLLITFLASLGG